MISKFDNKKDILLVLLYSKGITKQLNEPIIGRTRLVKMVFLFQKEIYPLFKKNIPLVEQNFYEFFPWNFGPFSKQVYDDLTFFKLRGFIRSTESKEEGLPEAAAEWNKWMSGLDLDEINEYSEEELTLTPYGENYTKGLYDLISDEQKEILTRFKKNLSNAPLRAILKYVYEKYPEQTDKSQILDDILGN
jgi:uncharacterized protein